MIRMMPLFLFFELVGKALILLAIGLQLYASFLNNMRQDIQHELTRDTLSLRLPITKEWLDGKPEPVVPSDRQSSYESVKTEEKYLQMMIDRSIFADAPLAIRYSTYWFYVFALGSILTLLGTYLEKRKKFA